MHKLTFFFLLFSVAFLTPGKAQQVTDSLAENMLVYQRSVGGWPKAIGKEVVKYEKQLTAQQKKAIQADSLAQDATIDNKATTREILYLIPAYQKTKNLRYLQAAKKGINYLFKAQYANGGWPQYYPLHNLYRGQVTYNDNAMISVLNIMQDIATDKNGFEILGEPFKTQAKAAVEKGIQCILKTQVLVNGKLTVWCAQYDENTLKPAKARAFELVSLSGMESVGIVEFLMRIKKPCPEIKKAIHSAVSWFETAKIEGYNFATVKDASLPKGIDKVLVKDPASTIWARFYDIDTNEPFFTGRDGEKKKTVAEIEHERRVGYAWYGTWPAKLFDKKYAQWVQKNP
ncbi:pectate lyase [Pedobacter sp.]|uniref:pectate lyase n=1 Tax=Pedobacter sp. TaxID=1411316 RepID=UPI003D7F8105